MGMKQKYWGFAKRKNNFQHLFSPSMLNLPKIQIFPDPHKSYRLMYAKLQVQYTSKRFGTLFYLYGENWAPAFLGPTELFDTFLAVRPRFLPLGNTVTAFSESLLFSSPQCAIL
jgi:hypothetical protein